MTVADRIRNRRIELNITQKELSVKIGTKDRSSISKIEARGNDISLKDIARIAHALDTTSAYLLGWEDRDGNPTDGGVQNNETEMAMALYKQYLSADPNIRAAIDTLLKSSQSGAEPLDKH